MCFGTKPLYEKIKASEAQGNPFIFQQTAACKSRCSDPALYRVILLLCQLNTNDSVVVCPSVVIVYLALPTPCISEKCIEIKINLNFYYRTTLWYLKKF